MLYNIIVLQLFLQLKVSQLKTMPNYNKSFTIKCPRHYCNFGRPQIRGCVGTNQIAATMINLVGEFLIVTVTNNACFHRRSIQLS